jgi:hypothetical protein
MAMKKTTILNWAAGAGVVMALAACGGGGGSDGGSAPAAPVTLSALNGTWTASCVSSSPLVKKTDTDTSLSFRYQVILQEQGGKLAGDWVVRVYEATDCSGTPLDTRTAKAEITSSGTATVSGKTALKTGISVGAPLAGFGGQVIKIDQVTYVNADGGWTSPDVYNDLAYLEGNLLFRGDHQENSDAAGYPTALDLDPASAWVKAN